jgi:capsular polysaccharide transport system permease protein
LDLSDFEASNLRSAARRQSRVLLALMLRYIRTRFFGSGLGYLVAIGWPLSHILIIVAIYATLGRAAPYGDSIVLFIATGTVPFMIFSYLSRFMMISIIYARPLLAFPEVKVLDILIASALLEILTACCVTFIFIILAWAFGIDIVPRDLVQATYAFGAAVLLGFGFGMLNGVMVLAVPMWFTGYALLMIAMWISAGVFFVPDALPHTIREILAYQPVLQVIEWTRSAYYEGYGGLVLDRRYIIGTGLVTVFLGFLLERVMRGHLLAVR